MTERSLCPKLVQAYGGTVPCGLDHDHGGICQPRWSDEPTRRVIMADLLEDPRVQAIVSERARRGVHVPLGAIVRPERIAIGMAGVPIAPGTRLEIDPRTGYVYPAGGNISPGDMLAVPGRPSGIPLDEFIVPVPGPAYDPPVAHAPPSGEAGTLVSMPTASDPPQTAAVRLGAFSPNESVPGFYGQVGYGAAGLADVHIPGPMGHRVPPVGTFKAVREDGVTCEITRMSAYTGQLTGAVEVFDTWRLVADVDGVPVTRDTPEGTLVRMRQEPAWSERDARARAAALEAQVEPASYEYQWFRAAALASTGKQREALLIYADMASCRARRARMWGAAYERAHELLADVDEGFDR